jgi:hypothetical protein
MSLRPAVRLESVGFEQVYDYTAGKVDWGRFDLPSKARRDARRASAPMSGATSRAAGPTIACGMCASA